MVWEIRYTDPEDYPTQHGVTNDDVEEGFEETITALEARGCAIISVFEAPEWPSRFVGGPHYG